MATILLIATFAIGWAMVVAGWRGRRVDDHPVCRACGFDLFGRDPQSTRCSECGADLDAPAAIRDGHRVRRTGMLVTGVLLTVHALFLLGSTTFIAASGIDMTPYKPDWVLAREVTGPTNASAGKALAELTKRVQAGTVGDRNILSVANACLAKQGQRNLVWDPAWGRFIEAARAAGKLPDEQWRRYAQQAFVPSLRLDRLDGKRSMPNPALPPAPVKQHVIVQFEPRVAGAQFVAFFEWGVMWIDDDDSQPLKYFGLSRPRTYHGWTEINGRGAGGGTMQSVATLPTAAGKHLAAGDHTLHGMLRLRIFDSKDAPHPPRTWRREPDPSKQIMETEVGVSMPFIAVEPVEPEGIGVDGSQSL